MVSAAKFKSLDFFRKTPRDLTEASLSGAGISVVAAISMIFLFGMEIHNFMTISTSTSIVVDKSSCEDSLRIDFNISFPVLSCEFASVDVSDVLGTNRLNITKTIRKYSINQNYHPSGFEYDTGPVSYALKHDMKVEEGYGDGSIPLHSRNFDKVTHDHPLVVVNFFAPWCHWSNLLKPAWEKTAKVMRQRYHPEFDGRIIIGSVDCTEEADMCRKHHIQGYPSIRIYRKGSDVRDGSHGIHIHETYYGDRDTDTLILKFDNMASAIKLDSVKRSSAATTDYIKVRPAPPQEGCRIEGFVRVKKVPGNLIVSASSAAHSFDASLMNMSHMISTFSFGSTITPVMMSDMKRLAPFLDEGHNRLNGHAYVTKPEDRANVTVSRCPTSARYSLSCLYMLE